MIGRLVPWPVKWKRTLLECLIFAGIVLLWLVLRPAQSSSRWLVGSLSILAPAAAAAILIFRYVTWFPVHTQRAWRFLGWALVYWSLGMGLRMVYQMRLETFQGTFWIADAIGLVVYPLMFQALLSHPFENRFGPSKLRFLLDAIITSGVVATLCWLMLAQPNLPSSLSRLTLLLFPVGDLIILMMLFNMLMANPKARSTLLIWGAGLVGFLVSDFLYSLLTPVGGYQPGGAESLGWMAGGLIFVVGAARAATPEEPREERRIVFDLGMRIQNVLPFTLVMALCWFVLADWRLTGKASILGLTAGGLLVFLLIIRIGLQAGEVELHKYWQLFDSISEPTFLCDQHGKILLGNPALAKVLGLKEEKAATGKLLGEVFAEQAISADLFTEAARKACSLEVTLKSDGTPYLLSLSPIFSESRRVLLAGTAQNLSDQKQQQKIVQDAFNELKVVSKRLEELNSGLEEKVEERTKTLEEAYLQLEQQHKQLQALDQLKSDFVSMVSHELRTPLTSLNGGLELLLTQKGRKPGDVTTLSLMQNEIRRLTLFVENILNISSIEAGRITIHAVPVSLRDEVEEVRCNLGHLPGSERIELMIHEGTPHVIADTTLLRSILNHLLDNALKYSQDGPVTVRTTPERGKVRVDVIDQGLGIPEEKRPFLFQRFQRLHAKDSQSVYGYGLGLYLSQKMLQAMGGKLSYESPEKGGSCFSFRLKAAK